MGYLIKKIRYSAITNFYLLQNKWTFFFFTFNTFDFLKNIYFHYLILYIFLEYL